jgi:glycine cleavage system H protein
VTDNPGLINVAPYTDAWLIVARPDDAAAALALLRHGPEAVAALKEWVDRYDIECMRCAE